MVCRQWEQGVARKVNPKLIRLEEFVLVEDASDGEEAISYVHETVETVEDPIFVIPIEHDPIQSTVKVKEEESRLIEDPLIQPATTASEGEELACLPIYPSTPRPRQQDVDVSPTIDRRFLEMLSSPSVVC